MISIIPKHSIMRKKQQTQQSTHAKEGGQIKNVSPSMLCNSKSFLFVCFTAVDTDNRVVKAKYRVGGLMGKTNKQRGHW